MSISLRLLCRFAVRISSLATTWSHILPLCILQTMGNIFWPHVAKKNNLSEPHIQRPLYIWTHTWTVCSTVHTTAKTVGAIWEACTKTWVSKEEEGWMLYTVGFCMAPTGPLAYLLYYSHEHRCAITQPFSSYWEYSVWSFIRLWSDLLIPMASCQRINPPSPGEERPLQHLWSVCSSCQPSIEDNCLFKILRACDLPSMEPKRRLCFTSGSGCVQEGVEVQTKEGLILIWTQNYY